MLMTFVAGISSSKLITTLAVFQAQDSINSGNSKLLMFFIGIAAVALLAQAIVVVAVGLGLMKAQKEVMSHFIEIKSKAMPLIASSHGIVTDLTPTIKEISRKVNTITTHVEGIAAMVEQKANEFSPTISAANQTVAHATETVAEANRKSREQIVRVDGMVTQALNATARFGVAIEKGITVPGREIAGIVSGLKAGLDTLLSGARVFGSGAPIGRRTPYSDSTPLRSNGTPLYPRSNKPNLDL
jgi:uncharacterized protein YoxC